MEVRLLADDFDFNMQEKPSCDWKTLSDDLELKRIISAMGNGDDLVENVCDQVLSHSLKNIEQIRYRQDILKDCISNSDTIRKLYKITCETKEQKSRLWSWLSPNQSLSINYSSSITLLKLYSEALLNIRNAAVRNSQNFHAKGWKRFIQMLQDELSDDYFTQVRALLNELKDEDNKGILISANLGNYCQGVNYVLRRKEGKHFWWHWSFSPEFNLAPRDDAGASDFGKRRDRAINESTNVLSQSAEHIGNFFLTLQQELAFYIGCLNLHDKMKELKMPLCIPELLSLRSENRKFDNLYDISLALTKNTSVIGNRVCAENKRLTIITGANQGGKSTFLRSIGQAQLMMQCGMFVGAESFQAPIRNKIFTHFKKEEDSSMKSGKLDEELSRMNQISDQLSPYSFVLFNESFAATNEREGSEICRQITKALIDNKIEVFSVTHLYTYAISFLQDGRQDVLYLTAQRSEDGTRTFQIAPGQPVQTAYGEDLYRKIFLQKNWVLPKTQGTE
ncbi:DNA mismatch repair protein MutS [Caproiciproducens galactitolivorans]|uniref:Endonuclease MutS2 n=1 Tax=Caproiciproducens galactitolivorans TaxID=642589 RepID=A0A4Z0XZ51_9FIRM|nr:DNA mismatch repair protein MutS [Caproiciproducens galactitolivorans]QEY35064.1 DNA mismatch repair protein MutS [Caproiciproducens galactitolivorans]TGJ76714.1 endonuclease MutS2 [Caproiciproducens galactitolivorans]